MPTVHALCSLWRNVGMPSAFFALAARSPGRQIAFRRVVAGHMLLLGGLSAVLWIRGPGASADLLGWLAVLPDEIGAFLLSAFFRFHTGNPFGVMRSWFGDRWPGATGAALDIVLLAAGLAAACLWRGAGRLQPHFHELHYLPVLD